MYQNQRNRMETKWQLPEYINDNFDRISLDFYKAVFEQSESILKEKIDNGDLITKRAFVLISIAAPAMTLSLGFLSGQSHELFKVAAFCEAIFCFISLIILCPIILKRVSYPMGYSPRWALKEDFIKKFVNEDGSPNHEMVMKNLYLNMSVTNDMRISKNEQKNIDRVKYVDSALLLLCASPFLSGLVGFFVSDICRSLGCTALNHAFN